MRRLIKKAEMIDYRDKEIPEYIIEKESLQRTVSLYWREITIEDSTIEVWSTNDSKFLVFEGRKSEQEWKEEDVKIIGEYGKLTDSIEEIRSNFTFKVDEKDFHREEQ